MASHAGWFVVGVYVLATCKVTGGWILTCGMVIYGVLSVAVLTLRVTYRTATIASPLLVTSGLVRYEAVLDSCGTSPVGGGGVLTCDSAHS